MIKEHIEGVFNLARNGIGYVKNFETKKVFKILKEHRNTALNRDKVLVSVIDQKNNFGKVEKIIKRSKIGFAGELFMENGDYKIKTDDFKAPSIIIPEHNLFGAKIGQKVFTIIESFKTNDEVIGSIKKILGEQGENNAEMFATALEKGFDNNFSDEVLEEAKKIKEKKIDKEDLAKRRDLREVNTFTIDPSDAKDFDDALSFKILENKNYEIGIHIADVSHYIRPDSKLDIEAQKRTTSVYLVDRTISMLPKILSDDLCSLKAKEDKLTFSAIFEIQRESGKVLSSWFGKTIINSDKRFTYEEAQEIIDKKEGMFSFELLELNRISKIYEKNRYDKGSLFFDKDEIKFVLDKNGKPLRVIIKERIETNKLIEEFMLLANTEVAKFMTERKRGFFIYRIHNKPEEEKMKILGDYLSVFGYEVKYENGLIPSKTMQKIINQISDKDTKDTIQSMIIRSMQKAVYSIDNIGHYGLAFKNYTHFTSPIRRYPDILVHRLLQAELEKKEVEKSWQWYQKMCVHSSEREKDASEAERNSIKYKQVQFMAERIGMVFEGIVTGASKFGLFVMEKESHSEGMIRFSDLGNDYFIFNEKKQEVFGDKKGEIFRIGDHINILVKNADLGKRVIDYKIVLDD